MPDTTPSPDLSPRAQRLLDAQVAYHLDRLRGDALVEETASIVTEMLASGGRHRLGDLVDPDDIVAVVERALSTVPGSVAVEEILDLVTGILHDGPPAPFPIGALVERDRVEELLDELLALHPVLERALERLTQSPLVGAVASRFMGRIVGDVVQANKAMAGKVPGLGSLVSMGTNAASKAMGAADKQVEALIGGTVGKGGTYAVRRLNRIVVDTVRDPTTRDALLEVWDLVAREPVAGLERHLTREELAGIVGSGHRIAVGALASEHAAVMARTVVTEFFDRFGDRTPTQLLADLAIDEDDLVADATRIAPRVVEALHESGDLERLVRARLEPFYASPEVAALLS